MATGNIQQAEGVLKIVTGRYTKNYETTAMVFNRANKGSGNILSDRGFEIPTEIEGNWSHGWMTDGGPYPAGGSIKTIRQKIYFKDYVHSVRLTVRAIETISSDRAAIKSWTEKNFDSSIEAAYKVNNWYALGNGNGVLATVSTGATSTTQTFSNNNNVRYMRNGMRVSFYDPTLAVLRGSATITSYPIPGDTTITLSVSVATTTSDVMTVYGGANQAITGIKAIVDDTTEAGVMFQDNSRNTYRNLRAQVIDANSETLDLEILTRMVGGKIQVAMGNIERDRYELWSYTSQSQAFSSIGYNLKRITEGSKSVKLGYTSYEFQGMAWTEEIDMDKERVYYMDWKKIEKYVGKAWGWIQPDGKILRLVPSDDAGSAYDAMVEGYYGAMYNLGSPDTRGMGKIIDLAIAAGY